MITLDPLNRAEAVRYLGDASVEMNETMEQLLDTCENEVLQYAQPRYLTKVVDLPYDGLLEGEDIRKHLAGCERAVLVCATLGNGIDLMMRRAQVTDMSKAVVLDVLSSVAIEQVGTKVDEILRDLYPDQYFTFRFSPGYGDYPLSMQKFYLNELNAAKRIGLNTNNQYLLTPTKSITAVAGMSEHPVERKHRGCATCKAREHCRFRKVGDHCGGS